MATTTSLSQMIWLMPYLIMAPYWWCTKHIGRWMMIKCWFFQYLTLIYILPFTLSFTSIQLSKLRYFYSKYYQYIKFCNEDKVNQCKIVLDNLKFSWTLYHMTESVQQGSTVRLKPFSHELKWHVVPQFLTPVNKMSPYVKWTEAVFIYSCSTLLYYSPSPHMSQTTVLHKSPPLPPIYWKTKFRLQ